MGTLTNNFASPLIGIEGYVKVKVIGLSVGSSGMNFICEIGDHLLHIIVPADYVVFDISSKEETHEG